MKKSSYILYFIVIVTSSTTVLTLVDGTLLGLLRGLAIAAILDGSIVFWENSGETLKDETQRKWSNGMKWAAVAMLLCMAIAFVLTQFVPVDAKKAVDIFGMKFTSTIREVIHWSVYAMIGAWVVLTLSVILYLRQIDPDAVRERERQQTVDAAEKVRADKEDKAFKTAMDSIAEVVGTERGVLALERRLEQMVELTDYERQQLVNIARAKIQQDKTGGVPVDAGNPFANRYQFTAPDAMANPTKPSTQKT